MLVIWAQSLNQIVLTAWPQKLKKYLSHTFMSTWFHAVLNVAVRQVVVVKPVCDGSTKHMRNSSFGTVMNYRKQRSNYLEKKKKIIGNVCVFLFTFMIFIFLTFPLCDTSIVILKNTVRITNINVFLSFICLS